ncbi:hypothetical protein C8Z91_19385 [Paenibacillus elgii]|uniref:GYF domain-containing protein n=1 Tax=Paenibacillus elgii TaxID=189691 RepID=A0A2T6G032_9BACL|nr:DUF4339 domain-containing protein [Paenibacillus elgii]PUA37510.1 hypothetical protein C8Z91_19385 [Paenibacillus elgii]
MKRTWYYQATAAEGPFSQTEMEHLIANGIIDGFTNVRATTGGPWMPAKDTNAFHTAFHAAFDALPRQRPPRKHKFSRRAFLYAICFIVNLLVVILLLNSLGQLANLSMMGLSHTLGGMPVPEYPGMVAAYRGWKTAATYGLALSIFLNFVAITQSKHWLVPSILIPWTLLLFSWRLVL